MTLYLDLSPFAAKFSTLVYEKRTALHAHEFSAVQGLFLDDVETPAEFLVRVRQQVERELLLFPKFVVRRDTVSRSAKNDGLLSAKFAMQIAEILALGCTARCRVLRVEIDNDFLPA